MQKEVVLEVFYIELILQYSGSTLVLNPKFDHVIAGFPSSFIGILFSSSLFIEVIFSLDGLGLLGYEAALTRDYPVIFATLYFFSLLGLVMGILGDIMYSIIDPRIDFESREN